MIVLDVNFDLFALVFFLAIAFAIACVIRKIKKRKHPSAAKVANAKAAFGGALDIEYTDAKGAQTERYIEAKSLQSKDGKLYLWGWCEMRQEIRQFRVDRISELIDGETGEVVDPRRIAAWLMQRAGMKSIAAAE